ncbi:MAG: response regulator [Bacteroidia bacterium]
MEKEKVLSILIADDHAVVREGLRLLIQNEHKDAKIGQASSGIEVFKKIAEGNWDLVVMDINMPGRDGLEVLDQLKAEEVHLPVIILSMHPEEYMGIRAIRTGAAAYITKDAAGEMLIDAINKVLSGKKYITPAIAEQMAEQLDNPLNKKPHELLSNRELQTTVLLASGKTVSEIAKQLSLSVATISTYRSRILEKMSLKNNADLMAYAMKNALV